MDRYTLDPKDAGLYPEAHVLLIGIIIGMQMRGQPNISVDWLNGTTETPGVSSDKDTVLALIDEIHKHLKDSATAWNSARRH